MGELSVIGCEELGTIKIDKEEWSLIAELGKFGYKVSIFMEVYPQGGKNLYTPKMGRIILIKE